MIQIAQNFPPPDPSTPPSSRRSSNVIWAIFPRFGIMIKLVAPHGGGRKYDSIFGGYDQIGVQTLTFTRDPVSQRAEPSSLSGHLINGNVVLSWWGSAYATSYSVRRGNQTGGPYTTIATGITSLLSYTDKVAAGTYYYVVVANTSTTSVSNEVKVVVNPQLL